MTVDNFLEAGFMEGEDSDQDNNEDVCTRMSMPSSYALSIFMQDLLEEEDAEDDEDADLDDNASFGSIDEFDGP
jgi:hypothetical protein